MSRRVASHLNSEGASGIDGDGGALPGAGHVGQGYVADVTRNTGIKRGCSAMRLDTACPSARNTPVKLAPAVSIGLSLSRVN